jgi:tetratricopeptide (TPR) repeat protein
MKPNNICLLTISSKGNVKIMAAGTSNSIKLFFSYSHKDEELRNQLALHLTMLKREGVIQEWHDRRIIAGQEWGSQIDVHLNTADIILLLVSADFLASDYCYDIEVKRAMQRHASGEACVIPVIIRTCDWTSAPFGKLQVLPKDARPVTRWDDRDEAFLDIAKGIRSSIENYITNLATRSASHHSIDPSIPTYDTSRMHTLIPTQVQIHTSAFTVGEGQLFINYESDLRPVVDAWVGRENELSALERIRSGVAVISGIGGQGKSTLVAKFLDTWLRQNPDGFWDWRDCREEGERFYTQLVALIERLTDGVITGNLFPEADTKLVVRYFFELVREKKGVIVLDNVDYYVEQAEEKFSLGVGLFVQEALRVRHNLLIILTCRPHISYPSPRFLELPLRGLYLPETIDLFKLRGFTVSKSNQKEIEEIWARTEGHPLWLNLIAVQMFRNPQTAPNILDELRKGHVDDRTRSMFRALWNGLVDRQKMILRCMAEITYPETADLIQALVGTLIKSRNHFNRAFNGIRALSLVVERGSDRHGRKFDLHPLVRSFVRTEYPTTQERLPYIQPILLFLAQHITAKSELSQDASLEEVQRWTAKAELELATNDPIAALGTISRVADQLIARGFHEEFFRVARLILDAVSWDSIEMQDSKNFHSVTSNVISALVEHNREEEARHYLNRYEKAGGKRTVARLRFCDLASYLEWMLGNHERAIELGQEGITLKAESDIDSIHDPSTTLALALRDSGRLDEALKIFAPDQKIEDVLSEDHHSSGKGANFYGNIGRCLQFKGEVQFALHCYVNSAELLDDATDSINILNKGYASLWIGEALEELSDYNTAYIFYKQAINIWYRRAPLRVSTPLEKLKDISHLVDINCLTATDDEVNSLCQRWIANYRQSAKKIKV